MQNRESFRAVNRDVGRSVSERYYNKQIESRRIAAVRLHVILYMVIGKWKYFATQLEGLSKLTITRWCTGMNDASDIELYVFCDASSTAYEAVAYVVCDHNPNTPSLIMAKSRAVRCSAEAWSFPRKELIVVLEGARIAILHCNLIN